MRIQKLLIFLLFLTLISSGCRKAAINGDLDGQWQVIDITPAPSDQATARMYYCFSLHTVQLSFHDLPIWTSGNITYDGRSLKLDFPYADSWVSRERLSQFGINTNPVTFNIAALSKSRLMLQRGDTIITLRKF